MIIFGSRSKQIARETIDTGCPNCGSRFTTDLFLFQQYAHICWIPVIPTGRSGASQCSSCRQVFRNNEMPEPLQEAYTQLKAKTRMPLWIFSGLALAVLIAFLVWQNEKHRERNTARLLLAPQKGDIFEIKENDNAYTVYKVESVKGDSVYVRPNHFETNDESGIDDLKLKGDSSYDAEQVPFSISELKAMAGRQELLNIDRK